MAQRELIKWTAGEWHKMFANIERIYKSPGSHKAHDTVLAANKMQERPRGLKFSSETSNIHSKYKLYRDKGEVVIKGCGVIRNANFVKPAPATKPHLSPVAAQANGTNDPRATAEAAFYNGPKPSANNPFPNAPFPGVNMAPEGPRAMPDAQRDRMMMQDLEWDGPTPPTALEEMGEMLGAMLTEAFVMVFSDEQVRSGLRGLVETALGRESAEHRQVVEADEWSPTIRGPKVLVCGITKASFAELESMCAKDDLVVQLKLWEQSAGKPELRKKLAGSPDCVIAVTKFMSHSATQMINAKAKGRWIAHGGGIQGIKDKVQTVCTNWTRVQLASHPRAGSMSAESHSH